MIDTTTPSFLEEKKAGKTSRGASPAVTAKNKTFPLENRLGTRSLRKVLDYLVHLFLFFYRPAVFLHHIFHCPNILILHHIPQLMDLNLPTIIDF